MSAVGNAPMSASTLEELEQIAEAFTNENDTQKLVQLSKQLLTALDRAEVERNESEPAA
jgi:hypothetical protein